MAKKAKRRAKKTAAKKTRKAAKSKKPARKAPRRLGLTTALGRLLYCRAPSKLDRYDGTESHGLGRSSACR